MDINKIKGINIIVGILAKGILEGKGLCQNFKDQYGNEVQQGLKYKRKNEEKFIMYPIQKFKDENVKFSVWRFLNQFFNDVKENNVDKIIFWLDPEYVYYDKTTDKIEKMFHKDFQEWILEEEDITTLLKILTAKYGKIW